MKKSSFLAATILGVIALPAQSAALLGATAGVEYWAVDSEINNVKSSGFKADPSVYVSLEHFIPLIPNGKLRYTGVNTEDNSTDYDQFDLIAYYEILDNDLIEFDIGLNLQHFDGKYRGQTFTEWQPNLYSNVVVGIPATPLSIYGDFSYGTFDSTSTVDVEAGAMFSLSLVAASIDFKLGYRVQDYDFNYFGANDGLIMNQGFYAGVQLSI